MPWEIARSSWPIMQLLHSMIRRSAVQKNCQKCVNTRESASRRRSVSLYHEARAHRQSLVLPRRLPCCSFWLPEVSQTCSQLIHTRFMATLASGLETRNQLRKRQEKNEFNFSITTKKFLDCKKNHACRWENTNSVSKNFRNRNRDGFGNRRDKHIFLLIVCASRVDRIDLCAKFPASTSGGQTLSKL